MTLLKWKLFSLPILSIKIMLKVDVLIAVGERIGAPLGFR